MTLVLKAQNIGKHFQRQWIFKSVSFEYRTGDSCAVIGRNGSGKSTLLKCLSGFLSVSEGQTEWYESGKKIPDERLHKTISWVAPYIGLIEEFTLQEHIDFHRTFKPLRYSTDELISILGFEQSAKKPVKFFSSGMKQKLKLALAFYDYAPVLLLDEPTTNLDKQNAEWYNTEVRKLPANKLILVGSNEPHEYAFCTSKLSMN